MLNRAGARLASNAASDEPKQARPDRFSIRRASVARTGLHHPTTLLDLLEDDVATANGLDETRRRRPSDLVAGSAARTYWHAEGNLKALGWQASELSENDVNIAWKPDRKYRSPLPPTYAPHPGVSRSRRRAGSKPLDAGARYKLARRRANASFKHFHIATMASSKPARRRRSLRRAAPRSAASPTHQRLSRGSGSSKSGCRCIVRMHRRGDCSGASKVRRVVDEPRFGHYSRVFPGPLVSWESATMAL